MAVRIVLVDDHRILRAGLRVLLEREDGFKVVGDVGDAKEAVESVLRLKPDVVIMDVQLPDETGIVATVRILQECPAIRVLVLSAAVDVDSIREALDAGASGYLAKDEAFDELVRAVRGVIAGKIHLSPSAATQLVSGLKEARRADTTSATNTLSTREIEVLRLMAEGLRNKEIADRINVSPKTVETYRARMMTKLGYSSTAELVRYAIRTGLIVA